MRANETRSCIVYIDIILRFSEMLGVATLEDYDWKENRTMINEERMGKLYYQHLIMSACFGPAKEGRLSVAQLMGGKRRIAVVFLLEVVALL